MLAASPRLDIFWCPSDADKYLIFGSELTLYKADKADYAPSSDQGESSD